MSCRGSSGEKWQNYRRWLRIRLQEGSGGISQQENGSRWVVRRPEEGGIRVAAVRVFRVRVGTGGDGFKYPDPLN